MKEAEAGMLIKTGVVERAVFYRAAGGEGWELHLYGQELHPSITNAVEIARGGRRTWSSLDTGHGWLKRLCEGRKVAVEVDG